MISCRTIDLQDNQFNRLKVRLTKDAYYAGYVWRIQKIKRLSLLKTKPSLSKRLLSELRRVCRCLVERD
jgi:hypothetical protein